MRTVHNNGEFWYENTDPFWKRVLLWFCWLGGWGTFRSLHAQDPQYWSWRKLPELITPISLFGHRFTLYGKTASGWWCDLKLRNGYLTYASNRGIRARSGQSRELYFSPDATPSAATAWYLGAPREVERKVDEWRRDLADLKAQHAERQAQIKVMREQHSA